MKKRVSQAVVLVLLAGVTFAMIAPYVWMATSALKSPQEFNKSPNTFFVKKPTLENFKGALDPTSGRMGRYLFNSLLYASTVTVFQLVLNSLAAFAFARLRWRGRELVFTLFLATMMLPSAVRLVPQYLITIHLGLADTLAGVVAPSLAGVFGIFLLRQFFLNIPGELEAAARIDGCSTFGVYWRIILPLAKPALITLGVFVFMAEWNNFVWPLVVLSDWDKYPVTVGVALFRDEGTIFWPKIFAASVMGSAPLVVLFAFAQKYIIGGIALSGMKAQ